MKRHSGLKLVAFNAYQPLMDIITNPYDNGMPLHTQEEYLLNLKRHETVKYLQEETLR